MRITGTALRSVLVLVLVAACQQAGPTTSKVTSALELDTDCDGVPDSVEEDLGLNPSDPSDGDDDLDGDHVPNAVEIRLGTSPKDPDSDGNSVDDGKQLADGLDLDGDGLKTYADNCPKDVNPGQEDADGDGIGDPCDPMPKEEDEIELVTILEAFDADAKDHAVRPASRDTLSRAETDRVRLLPMPSSFRVFEAASEKYGATVELHELYNPTTQDHAYVSSGGGPKELPGYIDLGILGYMTADPPSFGVGLKLNRFRNSIGEEAVTVDPATEAELVADGYTNLGKLGYVLADEGKRRQPISVVRAHPPGSGPEKYHHYRETVPAPGDESDGPRFKVFPERLGESLPLYRLRSPAGVEELSTNATEVASLRSSGYRLEGILGWVLDVADPSTSEALQTAELWRLKNDFDEHVYSADANEIDELIGQGYAKAETLGWVIVAERRSGCKSPEPLEQLQQTLLAAGGDPDARAANALNGMVAMCTISHLLDGDTPVTAFENAVAGMIPADAEARRQLKRLADPWRNLEASVKTTVLGELAPLATSACASHADLPALHTQIDNMLFDYVGPPPSLRQEFCDGTLYSATDPEHGTATESRAVTIDAHEGGEISTALAAKPRLDGVLDTEFVRGHPALEAAAAADPDRGYPLDGVDIGVSCINDSGCSASQGLKCVSGRCLAFPILRSGHSHTFTGVNLWDVVDGQIVLRDTVTNQPFRKPDTIVSGEPADASRCNLFGPRNHATIDVAEVPNRFYAINAVNQNGNFFEQDETVPADKDQARAAGRTIHLCWNPTDLSLPPDTVTDCAPVEPPSDCPFDGPQCNVTNGGRWGVSAGQSPRSLTKCSASGMNCGETPREFSSEDGVPRYVFIEDEPPTRKVVASLQGVTCENETGWDILGSDEMSVFMTRAGGPEMPTSPFAVGEAYKRDMDSGTRKHHIRHKLAVLPLFEDAGDLVNGVGRFRLDLLEEDEWIVKAIVGGVVIVAAGTAAALLFPASVPVWAAIGGSAAGIALWGWIVQHFGGDDPLGDSTVKASIVDVTDRGLKAHDFTLDPINSLTPDDANPSHHLRDYIASMHDSVDNDQYDWNIDMVTCTSSADCDSDQFCTFGVCVDNDWHDSEPGVSPQPPGFLELSSFQTTGYWYRLYVGWHTEQ